MSSLTTTIETPITTRDHDGTKAISELPATRFTTEESDQNAVFDSASTPDRTTKSPPDPITGTLYRRFGQAAARLLVKLPLFSQSASSLSSTPPCASQRPLASVAIQPPSPPIVAGNVLRTPYCSVELSSPDGYSGTHIRTDCVFETVTSSNIYVWDNAQGIFMGKILECPPPAALSTQWQDEVRARLLADLVLVLQKLPSSLARHKTIVEPELCMLGTVSKTLRLVELKPTIVIRCGSKRCQRAILRAVLELDYLKAFSKNRILVHHQPPRLAGEKVDVALSTLNNLKGAVTAKRVWVCRPSNSSACGLRVMTGSANQPQMCTLGGLIRFDGTIYGLTTAHCMISATNAEDQQADAANDSDSESESESDIDLETEQCLSPSQSFTDTSLLNLNGTGIQDSTHRKDTVYADLWTQESQDWLVADLGPHNYAIGNPTSMENNVNGISDAKDFALIKLPQEVAVLQNTYVKKASDWTSTHTVTSISPPLNDKNDNISRHVTIVCSSENVREGYLLRGKHAFLERATLFSTRKIELDTPLERGTSGAWVVQGSFLLGIIVAVYEHEPYAHMLEMTSVFDSVLLFNNEKPPTINLDLNSQEQKQKHFRHYKKRELNTDARAVEKSGPITKLIKWKKSSFPSLRTQNSAESGHDKQQKSVTASATALETHKSMEYIVLVAIFILMSCSWMNLNWTRLPTDSTLETDMHHQLEPDKVPQQGWNLLLGSPHSMPASHVTSSYLDVYANPTERGSSFVLLDEYIWLEES